jgi:hypothetical protein
MIKLSRKDFVINIDELKADIEAAFPSMRIKKRGKKMLIARASFLTGAVIVQKKKYYHISGNFPEFYQSLAFAIITVLSGIFIPVILYFIFIHRKLRKVEKELVMYMQAHLHQKA